MPLAPALSGIHAEKETYAMTSVLKIKNAEKSFGATRALDGAGLELHAGEWLALLGPNGAGKTTLVRSIAGRVRLDAGEIELLGGRLNGGGGAAEHAARGRLGVVPQEVALYSRLTARENLASFGALLDLAGSLLAERIAWALEWTALADRADELVEGFSGGMKRRLNIACSVLHQPEVVLLDEPTVGVDPQSRERIWEMLERLRRGGASLLLTTHQLDEAQEVCDRIVIIDHGKDVAAGTFDQLVRQTIGPSRRVTALLSDDIPASLLAAESGFEIRGKSFITQVEDVADEIPDLLTRIRDAGGRVADLQIAAPTLQAVFIHLTGRELRE